jgi:hypothetical protein
MLSCNTPIAHRKMDAYSSCCTPIVKQLGDHAVLSRNGGTHTSDHVPSALYHRRGSPNHFHTGDFPISPAFDRSSCPSLMTHRQDKRCITPPAAPTVTQFWHLAPWLSPRGTSNRTLREGTARGTRSPLSPASCSRLCHSADPPEWHGLRFSGIIATSCAWSAAAPGADLISRSPLLPSQNW